jgi:hypothetical protein
MNDDRARGKQVIKLALMETREHWLAAVIEDFNESNENYHVEVNYYLAHSHELAARINTYGDLFVVLDEAVTRFNIDLVAGNIPDIIFAKGDGPTSVVYKLYKDYGWEALFYNSDESNVAKYLGKPIAQEPKNILINYFSNTLADLLVKDADCVKNNPGEECKLGFDPIFASQDIAAYNLKITDIGDNRVNVEYSYPSTRKSIKITFFVTKYKDQWRISDIYYDKGYFLKIILNNKSDK